MNFKRVVIFFFEETKRVVMDHELFRSFSENYKDNSLLLLHALIGVMFCLSLPHVLNSDTVQVISG